MSFRLKIMLGVALIEGALLLLLIWLGLRLVYGIQQDELVTRASTTATLFASTTKEAVLASDLASLEMLTREVMKNPGVIYARVLDQHGEVMASKGDFHFGDGPFIPDRVLADVLNHDNIFDTRAEVVEGGRRYGQVQIGLDVAAFDHLYAKAKAEATSIALLEMGLVALFSWILGSVLTRQLTALKTAVRKVEDGALGYQVDITGSDELAHTAQAFNRMSRQVEGFYTKMQEANQELQTRVSDLCQANALLESKEKHLESVFNTMLDGLLITDEQGTILELNTAVEQCFGYRRDQLLGRNVSILMPESTAHRHDGYLRNYIETGIKHIIGVGRELEAQHRDGHLFPVELVVSETEGHDGRRNFTGVIRDISARKRDEQVLTRLNVELEQRINARANEMQVLYMLSSILADPERPLDEVFHAILGSVLMVWSDSGESCARICYQGNCYQDADFRDGPSKDSAPLLINGEEQGVIEVVFPGEEGAEDPALFGSERRSLLDLISHEVSTAIEYRISLEGRQSMELQLRQAQKLEAVGQLAAGIAHEINTPTQFVNDNAHFLQDAFADYARLLEAYCDLVATIDGENRVADGQRERVAELAEELELDYLREEIPLAIGQSLDGLSRISRIVQAMKEFSHPGSEEKSPTDLNQAISATVEVSRNEWKYHAEVELDLDPGLPLVPVLPGEFNQVILNLVVNAAHAILESSDGQMAGRIRIVTRQSGEWAEVVVSDNGSGIPAEIRERIFDPFFTTKEVGKGTGQGLAIAWSVVVDKHGGSLEVESEEDHGSRFVIRLPLAQESPAGGLKAAS